MHFHKCWNCGHIWKHQEPSLGHNARMAGRETLLTPEVHDHVVKAVRAGNYLCVAAQSVGVHPATLLTWMRKGKQEEDGIYRDFRSAVKKAQAESELRALKVIEQQAKKNWTAAAWWLERTRPDRWALRDRIEMRKLQKEIDELRKELDGNRSQDAARSGPHAEGAGNGRLNGHAEPLPQ